MLEPLSIADDSTYFNDRIVHVKHRETGTLVGDRVKITVRGSAEVIFEGTAKPRTSIIVCSDKTVKTTGRLYGEVEEAEKWIVDGTNYKPKTWWEKVVEWIRSAATVVETVWTMTVQVTSLLESFHSLNVTVISFFFS